MTESISFITPLAHNLFLFSFISTSPASSLRPSLLIWAMFWFEFYLVPVGPWTIWHLASGSVLNVDQSFTRGTEDTGANCQEENSSVWGRFSHALQAFVVLILLVLSFTKFWWVSILHTIAKSGQKRKNHDFQHLPLCFQTRNFNWSSARFAIT